MTLPLEMKNGRRTGETTIQIAFLHGATRQRLRTQSNTALLPTKQFINTLKNTDQYGKKINTP